ncbi:MAG: hypothetical protein AAFU49_16615 [Pseudomonadota bacterium]
MALSFDDNAVGLWVRSHDGSWWSPLSADPTADDFSTQIGLLRDEAARLGLIDLPVLLLLPPQQVLSITLPSGGDAAEAAKFSACLPDLAGFPSDEMVVAFLRHALGGERSCLVGHRQTYDEARAYAADWGFVPGRVSSLGHLAAFGDALPEFRLPEQIDFCESFDDPVVTTAPAEASGTSTAEGRGGANTAGALVFAGLVLSVVLATLLPERVGIPTSGKEPLWQALEPSGRHVVALNPFPVEPGSISPEPLTSTTDVLRTPGSQLHADFDSPSPVTPPTIETVRGGFEAPGPLQGRGVFDTRLTAPLIPADEAHGAAPLRAPLIVLSPDVPKPARHPRIPDLEKEAIAGEDLAVPDASAATDAGDAAPPRPEGLSVTAPDGTAIAVVRAQPPQTPSIADQAEAQGASRPVDDVAARRVPVPRPDPYVAGYVRLSDPVSTSPLPATRPKAVPAPVRTAATRTPSASASASGFGEGDLVLLGVFGLDGSKQSLLRLPDGRVLTARTGDKVTGWRIGRIDRSSVRIIKSGVSRTLRLAGGL